MFNFNALRVCSSVLVLTASLYFLAACSSGGRNWGDKETGLVLRYGISEMPVSYSLSESIAQKLEVQGQSIEFDIVQDMRFTCETKSDETLIGIDAQIDTIYMKVTSPQKTITPDMTGIIGKTFNMDLSQLGKESNYKSLEKLVYVLEGEGEKTLSSSFQALFTDMPVKPVMIGDSWNTSDTIREKTERGELSVISKNINTLEGIENFMGVECAKIRKSFTGVVSGLSKIQTADIKDNPEAMVVELKTKGTVEGSSTIYFDFRKGIVMEELSEAVSKAEIEYKGEREVIIPMERKIKTTLRKIIE